MSRISFSHILCFLLLPAPTISTPSEMLYKSSVYKYFELRNNIASNHLEMKNVIALNLIEIKYRKVSRKVSWGIKDLPNGNSLRKYIGLIFFVPIRFYNFP